MNTTPVPDVYARLRRTGVVAVLVLDDANYAVPLARALLAGGVDCMELTLRTPAALGRRSFVRLHRAAEGVRSSTLSPAKRRQAVEHVRDALGRAEVTERRAWRGAGAGEDHAPPARRVLPIAIQLP